MQMILAGISRFLGVVTLYRTIGKEDFTYEDVFSDGHAQGSYGVPALSGKDSSDDSTGEADHDGGGQKV